MVRAEFGRARAHEVVSVDGGDREVVGAQRGEVGEAHRVLRRLSDQRAVAVDAIADDPRRAGGGRRPPERGARFADFGDAQLAGHAGAGVAGDGRRPFPAPADTYADPQRPAGPAEAPAGVDGGDRDSVRAVEVELDDVHAPGGLPGDDAIAPDAVTLDGGRAALGGMPCDAHAGVGVREHAHPPHPAGQAHGVAMPVVARPIRSRPAPVSGRGKRDRSTPVPRRTHDLQPPLRGGHQRDRSNRCRQHAAHRAPPSGSPVIKERSARGPFLRASGVRRAPTRPPAG